jgi:hypothetical protein
MSTRSGMAVVLVLVLASSVCRAQTADECAACSTLDLHPPASLPPDPATLRAKRMREGILGGVLLALAGAGAVAAGGGYLTYNNGGDGGISASNQAWALSGIALGAGAFGAGLGLAIAGGTDTTKLQLRHAKSRLVTGAVLTALGGAMTLASIGMAASSARTCANDDDGICGTISGISVGLLSAFGSLGPGVGVPLLTIGARERNGDPLVRIDSFGPVALPSGGGVGFSGRF